MAGRGWPLAHMFRHGQQRLATKQPIGPLHCLGQKPWPTMAGHRVGPLAFLKPKTHGPFVVQTRSQHFLDTSHRICCSQHSGTLSQHACGRDCGAIVQYSRQRKRRKHVKTGSANHVKTEAAISSHPSQSGAQGVG